MVSNSGTMLSASASPRSRPDFLQQHRDLEQVGHRLALGDDVVRQRGRAVVAMDRPPPPRGSRARCACAPRSRGAASTAAAAWRARAASSATRSRSGKRSVVGARPARTRAARPPPPRARRRSAAGRARRDGSRTPRRHASAGRSRRDARMRRAVRGERRLDHREIGEELARRARTAASAACGARAGVRPASACAVAASRA